MDDNDVRRCAGRRADSCTLGVVGWLYSSEFNILIPAETNRHGFVRCTLASSFSRNECSSSIQSIGHVQVQQCVCFISHCYISPSHFIYSNLDVWTETVNN